MKRCLCVLLLSLALFYSVSLWPSAYANGSIGFVKFQFSSSKIYQGDPDAYVDLEIRNDGNSSVLVHGTSVHFDWQAADESFMVGSQRSGDPWDLGKALVPAENFSIRIDFSVPPAVSVGGHNFFFQVFYDDGAEATWNPRERDPYAELTIYDMWEPLYNTVVTTVEEEVTQAEGFGFISPEATAKLQRANELLFDAYSYAEDEKWQSAFSRLQSTSKVIEDAYGAEERFRTYLIIGGVIGIGAVIGVGLFLRRRRRRSRSRAQAEKVTG